jgi:hypothetical protein
MSSIIQFLPKKHPSYILQNPVWLQLPWIPYFFHYYVKIIPDSVLYHPYFSQPVYYLTICYCLNRFYEKPLVDFMRSRFLGSGGSGGSTSGGKGGESGKAAESDGKKDVVSGEEKSGDDSKGWKLPWSGFEIQLVRSQ